MSSLPSMMVTKMAESETENDVQETYRVFDSLNPFSLNVRSSRKLSLTISVIDKILRTCRLRML